MRAPLLLTALLLSAHLFHTEARLAQGRRYSGSRGRVETGAETDADTAPDAWDRRRLLQDPAAPASPSPSPGLGTPAIVGISVGALAVLVGVVGGLAIRRNRRTQKRRAEEAALEAQAQAALAQVEAAAAEKAAAAAQKQEERAKATAKKYADFLTRLEGSTPGQGRIGAYVPPENADALRESISAKLAKDPKAQLTAEENAYIAELRHGNELYLTLANQVVETLATAPAETARTKDITNQAKVAKLKLDTIASMSPADFVKSSPDALKEFEGVVKQADTYATKANKAAMDAAIAASQKSTYTQVAFELSESNAAALVAVRKVSAGEAWVPASKVKLAAWLKQQQPSELVTYEQVLPVFTEMSEDGLLSESLSKSEVRTSQASSVAELGQLLIDNSPEWGSAIEEPFDRSFANSVGQAQWDEVFMADNDNGKLSQEEILKKQKVAELDRQLSVVQQEREANIQKQLAAEDKRQAAVKSGNAEDRKAAEKEQAALEEEAKKLADKKDALEKERAAEEGRRGG